jgi:hypothetical protein
MAIFLVSRLEPLLFLPSSSSIVLKRLSGLRSRLATTQVMLCIILSISSTCLKLPSSEIKPEVLDFKSLLTPMMTTSVV